MERSSTRIAGLMALSGLLVASPGWCAEPPPRYRGGLPPVLDPDINVSPLAAQASADRFAKWYADQGRPRFMVYWERELSDEIDQPTQDKLHVHDTPVGTGSLTTIVVEKGKEVSKPVRWARIGERDAWQIEAAFTDALMEAGAHFVDRAAAIRLQNLSEKEAREQSLEMQALSEKADVLCEILATPDVDALLGYAFRLTCRNTHSGAVLARTYSLGGTSRRLTDRPTVSGWRPPDNPVRTSERPALVGRRLAADLMAVLVTRKP